MTPMYPTRRALVAALALLPAGCSGILGGGGPPPSLYALTALDRFPRDWPKVRLQLLVDRPSASAALDTKRIALRRNELSFNYFANADWADSVPSMVQALLVDSLQRSGHATAVSRDTMAIRGDVELRIDMRHFEADYATGHTRPVVRIEFGLMLVRVSDRSTIATRTVVATRAPRANTVPAVVAAFNRALHEAMVETIGWTLKRAAAAHVPRGS
ncbi:MAG: ABC-type transport auxiliary lipoprotein family protein [Stellaceae bacterium]